MIQVSLGCSLQALEPFPSLDHLAVRCQQASVLIRLATQRNQQSTSLLSATMDYDMRCLWTGGRLEMPTRVSEGHSWTAAAGHRAASPSKLRIDRLHQEKQAPVHRQPHTAEEGPMFRFRSPATVTRARRKPLARPLFGSISEDEDSEP